MKEREDRYIARPKANTPEGKLATERWRETMQERYGNPSEFLKIAGAKGGSTPTTKPKGFAADRNRARVAGRLGGMRSRRRKKPLDPSTS